MNWKKVINLKLSENINSKNRDKFQYDWEICLHKIGKEVKRVKN